MEYSLFSMLDLGASALLAAAATFRAARYAHHFTGAMALGCLAGLAGPSVRDLLLSYGHLAVLADGAYLAAALMGGLLGSAAARFLKQGFPFFIWLEGASLGLATAVGAAKASILGMDVIGCILVGMAAGTLAGLLRDLCLGETPLALEADFYVTASAMTAMLLIALRVTLIPIEIQMIIAAWAGLLLRLHGHRRRQRLGETEPVE